TSPGFRARAARIALARSPGTGRGVPSTTTSTSPRSLTCMARSPSGLSIQLSCQLPPSMSTGRRSARLFDGEQRDALHAVLGARTARLRGEELVRVVPALDDP